MNTLGSIQAGKWVRNVAAAGAVAALLLAPVPALSQEPGRSGFYVGGHMGYLFGNGTFSNMMAYSEDDWRRIREQIQSTNAADRAKRS